MSDVVRVVTDDERRARMARRHAISPAHRVAGPLAATRAMTVLHATDASSVHLSVHARVDGVSVEDVDRALYAERSLVKQLAMRRTIFAFPRELLPAAWGSASARVATAEVTRLAKAVERNGIADDGAGWLTAALDAVVRLLADGSDHSASEIRQRVPEVAGTISRSPGKPYGSVGSIAPSVITLLGAQARIVRGRNDGGWRVSRPRWSLPATWLGEPVPGPLPPEEGYAVLVRHWLRSFGPGTEDDLVWWLGSTRTAVRRALVDVGAVPVSLESGAPAWLLPDDVAEEQPVEPWAALLPGLDPTTMGWRGRGFYLDPGDARYLFDSAGNAVASAWVDGRMVGAWVQEDAGAVTLVPVARVTRVQRVRLEEEADRLTAFLGGDVVTNVHRRRVVEGQPLS